jgi:hypothetical protein
LGEETNPNILVVEYLAAFETNFDFPAKAPKTKRAKIEVCFSLVDLEKPTPLPIIHRFTSGCSWSRAGWIEFNHRKKRLSLVSTATGLCRILISTRAINA